MIYKWVISVARLNNQQVNRMLDISMYINQLNDSKMLQGIRDFHISNLGGPQKKNTDICVRHGPDSGSAVKDCLCKAWRRCANWEWTFTGKSLMEWWKTHGFFVKISWKPLKPWDAEVNLRTWQGVALGLWMICYINGQQEAMSCGYSNAINHPNYGWFMYTTHKNGD